MSNEPEDPPKEITASASTGGKTNAAGRDAYFAEKVERNEYNFFPPPPGPAPPDPDRAREIHNARAAVLQNVTRRRRRLLHFALVGLTALSLIAALLCEATPIRALVFGLLTLAGVVSGLIFFVLVLFEARDCELDAEKAVYSYRHGGEAGIQEILPQIRCRDLVSRLVRHTCEP